MSKLPYLVIAVIVLMSMAACSIAEPWTMSQSTNGITLRWWSDELADAQAAGTAGAYCTQMGRAAETISIERDGSASIGHYRCV
jgi:putative hemolysin